MTEAQGIPVGLAVDGANRHDMKLVRATVDSLPVPRPAPSPDQPQGMCLDKGYDFDEVRRTLDEFGFTAHIRSRGEEAKAIKREAGFKARRWVVERSHSWLNRFRRILVRWDKSPDNYIAFLHFACALTALRAAGLLGTGVLAAGEWTYCILAQVAYWVGDAVPVKTLCRGSRAYAALAAQPSGGEFALQGIAEV